MAALPPKHRDPLGGFKISAVRASSATSKNNRPVGPGHVTKAIAGTPNKNRSASAHTESAGSRKVDKVETVKRKMNQAPDIHPGRLGNCSGITPRYSKDMFERMKKEQEEKDKLKQAARRRTQKLVDVPLTAEAASRSCSPNTPEDDSPVLVVDNDNSTTPEKVNSEGRQTNPEKVERKSCEDSKDPQVVGDCSTVSVTTPSGKPDGENASSAGSPVKEFVQAQQILDKGALKKKEGGEHKGTASGSEKRTASGSPTRTAKVVPLVSTPATSRGRQQNSTIRAPLNRNDNDNGPLLKGTRKVQSSSGRAIAALDQIGAKGQARAPRLPEPTIGRPASSAATRSGSSQTTTRRAPLRGSKDSTKRGSDEDISGLSLKPTTESSRSGGSLSLLGRSAANNRSASARSNVSIGSNHSTTVGPAPLTVRSVKSVVAGGRSSSSASARSASTSGCARKAGERGGTTMKDQQSKATLRSSSISSKRLHRDATVEEEELQAKKVNGSTKKAEEDSQSKPPKIVSPSKKENAPIKTADDSATNKPVAAENNNSGASVPASSTTTKKKVPMSRVLAPLNRGPTTTRTQSAGGAKTVSRKPLVGLSKQVVNA